MLKKAGIVVAAAAAALLAVSPLAFAGDKSDGDHGQGDRTSNKQINKVDNDRERSSSGIVNVDALNGDNLNNVNVCPNVEVDVLRILSNNALGILGGETTAGGNQTATCVNDSSTDQSNN